MVPIAERWYRQLIGAAVLIGGFGGLLALVYSGVTTTVTQQVFGSPTSEPERLVGSIMRVSSSHCPGVSKGGD